MRIGPEQSPLTLNVDGPLIGDTSPEYDRLVLDPVTRFLARRDWVIVENRIDGDELVLIVRRARPRRVEAAALRDL